MQLGLTLTGNHISLDETVDFARQAEDANFDSVWVTELWRDAFVPLTAMAVRTERIRLGSAVALTMARSPVLMELAAAGVDEISRGRMALGIGAGPRSWNENHHSVPFYPPADHLKEYADVLRAMWASHSQGPVRYPGKYLKIDGYQRDAKPFRESIPIYFGSVIPRSIRAAGASADGLCVATLHTPRYISDVVHPSLEEGRKQAGRSGGRGEIIALVLCSVDPDSRRARNRIRGQIAYYTTFPYYDVALDLHPLATETQNIREASARDDTAAMIEAVSDPMIDLVGLAGTPDECRSAVKRYEGLVDEVVLYTPTLGLSRAEILENHRAVIETFRR